MSPLSALAPDQRAVLELLLRQGRDYAELSELLGLPESGVRSRAHTALAALAPNRPAPVGEDGAVGDWILGQQDDRESAQTSESVARMPAWHAWASEVTDRLSVVDGAELPEIPQPVSDDEPAPARPAKAAKAQSEPARGKGRARPVRDATAAAGAQKARQRADAAASKPRPRPAPASDEDDTGGGLSLPSSRRGGLVLLGVAALVIAGVLFLVFRGGDDNGNQTASSTATPTATADAQVVNEVALKGNGNKAQGLMRVFKGNNGGLVFALAADKMPANGKQEVYAVWFTKKGVAPRNLGFSQTPVGKNGVFTTGGPQQGQETQFAKWLVDYDTIVVARASANSANAKKPGPVVLSGTLPGGQD